ncbi:MAG: PorP/SprF family type IX secretion system membrane protein [Bacteroidales bacterium]|nr:PorP/SprF family type IX secretion system membrane protein [Bacteroidales bacterium]
MNKYLMISMVSLLSGIFNSAYNQELPLLSPYYTNSFLYNPSLAGGAFNTTGSFFIANRKNFVHVAGHPVSNILSAHVPLKKNKCGIGGKILLNNTNVFQTVYSSVAFAYHIPFDHFKSLSFGLSSDLYHMGIDMSTVNVADRHIIDPNILKYSNGEWLLNFSTGFNFQTERLSVGGTINSLRNSYKPFDDGKMYSLYSAYLKYTIPVFLRRDILQPMVVYRQLPFSNPIGNAGIFYSYKSKNSLDRINDGFLLGGVFISTNFQISMMAGINILKRLQLTYNYETSGSYQGYIGASHEIALTYNIIELSKSDWSNEYLTWYEKKLKLKRFLSPGKRNKHD